MSTKPIFVATHPRACSTAFERVFMTRRDVLQCVHEPFGDAFYFGPERLSSRYESDEEARESSGFANTTYKDVADSLLNPATANGKRLFIKDITHYLAPPDHKPASIAPSLQDTTNGHTNGTPTTNGINGHATPNPTVLPLSILRNFHFTFLIRHPRRAIPSYYRCTIPPLSAKTGFTTFMPSEAGYSELRALFDYLLQEGLISKNPKDGGLKVTVVDADDLLAAPEAVVKRFCEDVGLDFDEGMLGWGDAEGQKVAEQAFEKWNGFHEDAIGSTGLRARVGVRVSSFSLSPPFFFSCCFRRGGGKVGRLSCCLFVQVLRSVC